MQRNIIIESLQYRYFQMYVYDLFSLLIHHHNFFLHLMRPGSSDICRLLDIINCAQFHQICFLYTICNITPNACNTDIQVLNNNRQYYTDNMNSHIVHRGSEYGTDHSEKNTKNKANCTLS